MRYLKPAHPCLLNFLLLSKFQKPNGNDEVKVDDDEGNEGWKRLKKMYSYGKGGLASPQFSMITDAGFSSFFMGFVYGAIKESKETYVRFIETNKTTMYRHQLEAKRQLQDIMTLSMAKGGWKVGWRLGLITASMITVVLSAHTYRGRSSVGEFSAAGAVTCGLYKLRAGPKPCLSGALVGGAIGTAGGIVLVGLMRITGVTFDDLFQHELDRINKHREEQDIRVDKRRKEKFENVPYRPGTNSIDIDVEDSQTDEADSRTENTDTGSS